MKRVLFLAYYFPPIAASGSLRPAGFSTHLREFNYDPLIVSTDTEAVHPPVRLDPSLMNLVEESVQVERLKHTNWLKILLDVREKIRSVVSNKSTSHKKPDENSSPFNSEESAPCALSRVKTAVLDRVFLFPDHQKPWMPAVKQFAKSLSRDQQPDVVVASGNPWSALIVGNQIAKELGVPFIADFRDPWTGNPKAAESEALHRLALREERKVLQGATRVIANTEELRQWFETAYPDLQGRFVSITNGYSESFRSSMKALEVDVKVDARVELCHLGSVYELRKPTALFKSLLELVEDSQVHPGDILLRFTGTWIVEDSECNELATILEKKGMLVREAAVNHEEYLVKLKQSQHLLILQQSFPLQIPGKIYEYVASGRPLVVVGGEGATANLVAQHKLGTACENDVGKLKEMLKGLVDKTVEVGKPSDTEIEQFGYRHLTNQFSSVLDEAIDLYQKGK